MENYKNLIDESKEQILDMIRDTVAVRSICENPKPKMPCGEGNAEVLKYMLDKAKEDGFKVKNVGNYAGHIEFKGKKKDVVAAITHLDIVSEGDHKNWDSDPFVMDIRDGVVYGRGVQDDKGPTAMCYYAMKALKDAGFKPEKTIRLILGCDEEIAGIGMEEYLKKEATPVMAFTPDAEFPVINGEKGIVAFKISKDIGENINGGIELCKLEGGIVHNVVPDRAEATLHANNVDIIKDILSDTAKSKKYKVDFKKNGKTLTVTTYGLPAHASIPELGKNAISVMMDILSDIKFGNNNVNDFIHFYNERIAFNLHGEKMNCNLEDKESGRLSFNSAIINMVDGSINLTVDIRVPVTFNVDEILDLISCIVESSGMTFETETKENPLYMDESSQLVTVLLDAYKNNTADRDAKAMSIGGGTYAKFIPNTIAFGPIMPDADETCHIANEHMTVDDIMTGTKIYAEALYELAK